MKYLVTINPVGKDYDTTRIGEFEYEVMLIVVNALLNSREIEVTIAPVESEAE